jgi:L-amino acid N-acyltransferase YncA
MAAGRMEGSLRIVAMLPEHAGEVLAICQAGVGEGDASVETAAPAWATVGAEKLTGHRLAALDQSGGPVLGWAAVAGVFTRAADAGVVEHCVYVHPAARGRGVGLACSPP